MLLVRILMHVILLNLVRYFVLGFIEQPIILPYLFRQMELNPQYFNTGFSTLDWVTSYFYNFMMWLVIVWVFHLLQPRLKGNMYLKSLKVFGIMWLFFASISAIYMNHYSHPKAFYVWNIVDALLIYSLLGLVNGCFYPIIVEKHNRSRNHDQENP